MERKRLPKATLSPPEGFCSEVDTEHTPFAASLIQGFALIGSLASLGKSVSSKATDVTKVLHCADWSNAG